MSTTTNYTDHIGREFSVTRYADGDKLTYRAINGVTVEVVATGPGHPMEPNFTPVRVVRSVGRWTVGTELIAANYQLTER